MFNQIRGHLLVQLHLDQYVPGDEEPTSEGDGRGRSGTRAVHACIAAVGHRHHWLAAGPAGWRGTQRGSSGVGPAVSGWGGRVDGDFDELIERAEEGVLPVGASRAPF